MSLPSRFQSLVVAIAVVAVYSGCQLVEHNSESTAQEHSSLLPPIATSPSAVQLEFVLVERPLGDPLFGKSLWDVVDQIGVLDPQVRGTLLKHGLRVGITGSAPPLELEALLELSSKDDTDPFGVNDRGRWAGRRVTLLAGQETDVRPTDELWSECVVNVPKAEISEVRSFEQARFLFRVRAEETQPGWANIEFVPQVHHGEVQSRPSAAEATWMYRTGQKIEPVFPLAFDLTLGEGEWALIGLDGSDPTSLGYHFFSTASGQLPSQRLLIIRLAETAKFSVAREQ